MLNKSSIDTEKLGYYAFYSFIVFCVAIFIYGELGHHYGGDAFFGYSSEGHYYLKSKLEKPVEVTYFIWLLSVTAKWIFYITGLHAGLAVALYESSKKINKKRENT